VAWFWTDDLATTLAEAGVLDESLTELTLRPAAIAARDEAAALAIARRIAGLDASATDAA
jgi:hypothetical protein